MGNIRVALASAFFWTLIWIGVTATDPAPASVRLSMALGVGGIAGFITLAAMVLAEWIDAYREYAEEVEQQSREDKQGYEMELMVFEGNTLQRQMIEFDNLQLRQLFSDLKAGRGAYAHTKEYGALYKRWDVDRLMPILEKMELVTRTQNYNKDPKNAKIILTEKGVRFANSLLSTTPPPKKDAVTVRI